jgi:antitoxin (DNA-binding transcriptional repressor) of toxin-antitoxin stability system
VRCAVRTINYGEVPKLCAQLLSEVESTGVTIHVIRNGKPFVRIEPVDETTKALFAARRKR